MNTLPRIGAREFVERGYLQEVNRQFLHRLGLAMEVLVEEDGSGSVGGIWDYRDDPEGMLFADLSDKVSEEKAARVAEELAAKDANRGKRYGWAVQPIGWKAEDAE